jgi:glycosyltransferase involved in cell wall biosynthesis
MKILYHHRVGSRDGQAVHIEEIVTALRDLGHEVLVVGPGTTERAEFGSDSGAIATLKRLLPRSLYELLELAYGCIAFLRLWRVYRRHRPDVLYERYNLYLLAGVWLKRLTGMPMLLEVNSPLVHERSRFGGLANQRLASWIERVTWRSADRALPVTNVLAGFLRNAGVAEERITVIQNGVGKEFLSDAAQGAAIRQRFGLDDAVVLGFTGFVREWHGLERVIELIADSDPLLKLHFLIVGDGPAIPELQRLAASRGVDRRVIFAGLVPRHDIVAYVAAFDVALQPQVVSYASPLKLFEYMALGRAIVAPSTPNICEVLSDREAVLFDPADPAAFRRAVEQLCHDAGLRARLGKAAREAIDRQGLTWANNARRIVALFDHLRESRSRVQDTALGGERRVHNSEP